MAIFTKAELNWMIEWDVERVPQEIFSLHIEPTNT